MKKKSIKSRIHILVSLFGIIFSVICLHLYFDSTADKAEQVQKAIIELEKDFSATTLAEENALESLEGINRIKQRYHSIENRCSGCHENSQTAMFTSRFKLFQSLFNTREDYRSKQAHVRDTIMGLVDSVSYIHEHHIVYLKNFLMNDHPGTHQAPEDVNMFDTRLPAFEPETNIIRIAVEVQSSLVDIFKSFNDLQTVAVPEDIRPEFEARMQVFFDRVKAFDDYSLDAQDGILVEELLLVGRGVRESFKDLLDVDQRRISLDADLSANRDAILSVFKDISTILEKRSTSLRGKTNLFRGLFLLAGMILLIWVVVDGTRIVQEIKRTVLETEILQDDLSYRISIRDEVFEEFQVVYTTMNSMADKITTYVDELERHRDRLEQRVAERTRDLFRINQELRNEIDERLKAEKELLDSRERLSMALDMSGGLVWEWNVTDGIMHLDRTILDALGKSSPEKSLCLADFKDLHDPENYEKNMKGMVALIKGEIPLYINEHRIRWADGSWHVYRVYGKVIKKGENNRSEILLGTAIDVTQAKLMEARSRDLEKRLQDSQKMEAIGTLARGIAHDFNNILGGIMGYSQLAKRNLAPDDKSFSYVEQIHSASIRAKDLIEQIMAFSRTSTSEKEPLSLKTIIDESLKLLRASIPTNIDIRLKIQPGRDVILANATQMHQVLMNLCTNAYQAMGEAGGELEIAMAPTVRAAFPYLENGDKSVTSWMKLSISDTGCGMDSDTMGRIFDPYFTTKKQGEGNGMGLATVHAIVKEHGGTINVRSRPGKGSTFEVFIPEADREPNNAAPQQEMLPFGSERILVVDDEIILTNVLQASLEDLGYEVVSITDSEEALAVFQQSPDTFDLVILDYIMPKMKGDVLAREIASIRSAVPIILCTGLKDPLGVGVDSTGSGIREVLSKPVDINHMAMRVRAVLDEQQDAV